MAQVKIILTEDVYNLGEEVDVEFPRFHLDGVVDDQEHEHHGAETTGHDVQE